ncbi:MAG TPA: ribosome maturation factor RimM [Candidatus Sulfotelmatobacter sp.]
MNDSARGEFITLARVVKTQGRWGEVAVEVHSDIPGRFVEGMRFFALPRDSASAGTPEIRHPLQVEKLWPHKDWLVLKFAGVDSIADAEALVGSELQVPSEERAHLDAGWNFVSDLVGCSVFDRGREIGLIEDVQFGAGEAPLLIVAGVAGNKFEVPFAEEYLESFDKNRRHMKMKLPEGLLELNGPLTAEEKSEQMRIQQQHRKGNGGSEGTTDSRRSGRSRR